MHWVVSPGEEVGEFSHARPAGASELCHRLMSKRDITIAEEKSVMTFGAHNCLQRLWVTALYYLVAISAEIEAISSMGGRYLYVAAVSDCSLELPWLPCFFLSSMEFGLDYSCYL